MSWRPITADDIAESFTPSENAALQAASNSATVLTTRLTESIQEFVGGMAAAGYPVNNDGTVPDQLRRHVVAQAVWSWLRNFPMLKVFKTDERKQAAADAQRIYEKIVNRTYGALEAPYGTDITTGNWNSEQKLIMRTMPTPPPAQQFQSTPQTPLYANPNAPRDSVAINSPGVPSQPSAVEAKAGDGSVRLDWDPALNAATYNILRGTTPGGELATPIASGITGFNYTDTGLTNGQAYYYKIVAVNGALQSPPSLEVSCTPTATP